MAEGVRDGTEEPLRRALELQPDHAGAIVALAGMLVAGGETEEAIALLGRIPETAETRRLLAEARLASQQVDVAADGVEDLLDGLLDRVTEDPAPDRSSWTCWRPSGPTTPGPPGTARPWPPACSDRSGPARGPRSGHGGVDGTGRGIASPPCALPG